jgi:hypothetical protein
LYCSIKINTGINDRNYILLHYYCILNYLKTNFLFQSPDLDKRNLFGIINSSEFVLARFSLQLQNDLDFICSEGVKELLDLFDSLGNLMKPIIDNPHVALLNKHSVLGLYVRRTIVLFEKLTFCKVVALFEDLKIYAKKSINEMNTSIDDTKSEHMFLQK